MRQGFFDHKPRQPFDAFPVVLWRVVVLQNLGQNLVPFSKSFLECFRHPGDFVLMMDAMRRCRAVVYARNAIKPANSAFKFAKLKHAAVEDRDVTEVGLVLMVAVGEAARPKRFKHHASAVALFSVAGFELFKIV